MDGLRKVQFYLKGEKKMIVTKTAVKAFSLGTNRKKANAGCNFCPCCGEGVLPSLISKTWTEGIFKMKNLHCDVYKCDNCSAEWESDPYEY